MTARAGVPVRGSCTAGHVTETVADKGRVTWAGSCGHDGCDLPVRARRVPKDQVPPVPPPGDTAGDSVRVVRITDYDHTSSGAQDDPGGLQVADIPAADLQPEPGGDGSDAGGPPDPIDEADASAYARWRARRRSTGSARRRAHEQHHPLGIF